MAPAGGTRDPSVAYDGDQKLLAFLGAAAFVMGALFWILLAVRFWGRAEAVAGAGLGVASALAFLLAWGLRVKMEAAQPLSGWEVRRLLIAGLVCGVVVGALPYFVLRFKLEDPDFMHVASEPQNLPPAWR